MADQAVRSEVVRRKGRSAAQTSSGSQPPPATYWFLVGVEGRVEVVQVERLRVDAAHDVQVVVRPVLAELSWGRFLLKATITATSAPKTIIGSSTRQIAIPVPSKVESYNYVATNWIKTTIARFCRAIPSALFTVMLLSPRQVAALRCQGTRCQSPVCQKIL